MSSDISVEDPDTAKNPTDDLKTSQNPPCSGSALKEWCSIACNAWRSIPKYPYFVKGDIDAFCGLFFDCLATLLLLVNSLFFFPGDLIYRRLLPGVGISLIFGNIWYGWMARRLAIKTGRSDVTAQPYGINTPGALAKVFLIVYPVYFASGDPEYTYNVALGANFISGMVEIVGCLIGPMVRKIIPPTALLTCLAGIGLAWLTINPLTALFAHPIVSWLPLFFVLMGYFAGVRVPYVPPTILALLSGTIMAWAIGVKKTKEVIDSGGHIQFYVAEFAFPGIAKGLAEAWQYIDIIVPVAMTNFVGTLECTESAQIAGDEYSTRESMLIDGIGTVLGASFGSIFGTTVYIGHPAYKKMGARAGYSILNGVILFLLCITGLLAPLFSLVARESVEPIIVFVGLMIAVQTFEHSESKHWPAIMVGILPALADWVVVKVNDVTRVVSGREMTILDPSGVDVTSSLINYTISQPAASDDYLTSNQIEIHGLRSMAQGALINSLLLTTMFIFLIDHSFIKATIVAVIASIFAVLGIIHSAKMLDLDHMPWRFAVAYAMCALLFILFWVLQKYDLLTIQSHTEPKPSAAKEGPKKLSVSSNLDTLLQEEPTKEDTSTMDDKKDVKMEARKTASS